MNLDKVFKESLNEVERVGPIGVPGQLDPLDC
jgi:hypothetical protein